LDGIPNFEIRMIKNFLLAKGCGSNKQAKDTENSGFHKLKVLIALS